MTDNFQKFMHYVEKNSPEGFGNGDVCYVVEILRRGKDNPELPAANYHFRNFYIKKLDDIDKFMFDIISICEALNARAYFSVNYKDIEQVAKNTVAELARRVASGDYKAAWSVWESESGKYANKEDQKWIVDLDKEHLSYKDDIMRIVQDCGGDLVDMICTRSGIHLITSKFNRDTYNKLCVELFRGTTIKQPDIQKNHITLLYENLK